MSAKRRRLAKAHEEMQCLREQRKKEKQRRQTILDRALSVWEDKCCFYHFLSTLQRRPGLILALKSTADGSEVDVSCPLEGPIVHWQDFRPALLTCLTPKERHGELQQSVLDHKRFMGGGEVRGYLHGPIGELPQLLWEWSCSSRRIYAVRPELQMVLAATSLHRITWGDIVLPFDSFGIELQKPFVDHKGRKFPFILVSKRKEGSEAQDPENKAKGTIHFLLLNEGVADYVPLSRDARQQIEVALARRDHRLAVRLVNPINERMHGTEFTSVMFDIGMSFNRCVEDQPDEVSGDEFNIRALQPIWQALLRISLGLGLYLKNLPPGSSHASAWTPYEPGTKNDPRAVSHAAQVCVVENCYTFSREERVMLGLEKSAAGTGREISCHWREGHWRRPPGLGKDPAAEKSVHVRPTLVRRDRLQ